MGVTERLAVTSILSDSWGGTIFAGRNAAGQAFRVRTWEAINIAVGDVLEVEGGETTYSDQHGRHRQIDATSLLRTRTSGRLIVPWLMTLDGIGRERAQMLFDRFGDLVVEVLQDPSNLTELADVLSPRRPSVGRKLAEYVLAQFAARSAAEEVGVSEIQFLRRLEQVGIVDRRAARALWRLIGSRDAYARLLEKPYAAAAVIPWREADALGLKLLKARGVREPAKDEERYVGAVDAAWRHVLRDGHTALDRGRIELILKRWGIPGIAVDASLTRHRTVQSMTGQLRAPGASFLEKSVATAFVRLRRDVPHLDWVAHPPTGGVELTAEQSRAIAAVRERGFTVVQGGAGVGKTTAMRALCDWHVASGGSVVQTAIAGKAALRLSRATGRLAFTVAKLLGGLEKRRSIEAEGGIPPEQLPRIDKNTLLVVDEASMVDLVSWRRLLDAVPSGARVVAVGDVAQLPPVGLGRVFHDLVADGRDTIMLSTVMRQAADSPIVSAAGSIRDGLVPFLPAFGGIERGLQHADCEPNDLIGAALRVHRELSRGTSIQDVLILAARRDTCGGVAKSMQARRQSDGQAGIRLGPLMPWAAIGDPVVATANRYDEALMNGQIGWIEGLDPLLVRFDGENIGREISAAARLELASGWCLTTHRAQGSEAKRVIVLLDGPTLITREWLYTAVTRAVEQVVLVGPRAVISAGIARREQRTTAFHCDLINMTETAAPSM